ncbi:MAG: hypothetical protein ACE5JO_11885 [Candidatus Binatia bacterium]
MWQRYGEARNKDEGQSVTTLLSGPQTIEYRVREKPKSDCITEKREMKPQSQGPDGEDRHRVRVEEMGREIEQGQDGGEKQRFFVVETRSRVSHP